MEIDGVYSKEIFRKRWFRNRLYKFLFDRQLLSTYRSHKFYEEHTIRWFLSQEKMFHNREQKQTLVVNLKLKKIKKHKEPRFYSFLKIRSSRYNKIRNEVEKGTIFREKINWISRIKYFHARLHLQKKSILKVGHVRVRLSTIRLTCLSITYYFYLRYCL